MQLYTVCDREYPAPNMGVATETVELEGLPFVFEIELHICIFHSLVFIRRYLAFVW